MKNPYLLRTAALVAALGMGGVLAQSAPVVTDAGPPPPEDRASTGAIVLDNSLVQAQREQRIRAFSRTQRRGHGRPRRPARDDAGPDRGRPGAGAPERGPGAARTAAPAAWWSSRCLSRGQPAVLKVFHRLDQLVAGVHHERPVLGDRLTQRLARDQQGARRRGALAAARSTTPSPSFPSRAMQCSGTGVAAPRASSTSTWPRYT